MKFEDSLRQLEALVSRMESGEMKLDDMIKSFEEGRRLVKACQDELASVRQRIEKVTQSGEAEPMDA
ncbi:MAG: exodeoxyribonuclease VII small subunit [Kiritimatiellae bacterium]|nr:exodeoxyribonuclease VII small subunit [Kiritimatiellia bacterium]